VGVTGCGCRGHLVKWLYSAVQALLPTKHIIKQVGSGTAITTCRGSGGSVDGVSVHQLTPSTSGCRLESCWSASKQRGGSRCGWAVTLQGPSMQTATGRESACDS
jgi:hypothetical protein